MSETGKDNVRIKKIPVRFYNLKELAAIYDLSEYRMRRILARYRERVGKPIVGYSYDAEQVALIFQLVQLPSNIVVVRGQT